MERTIVVCITDDTGILLDRIELKIPSTHTTVFIITGKPDAVVIGAEAELSIGAVR